MQRLIYYELPSMQFYTKPQTYKCGNIHNHLLPFLITKASIKVQQVYHKLENRIQWLQPCQQNDGTTDTTLWLYIHLPISRILPKYPMVSCHPKQTNNHLCGEQWNWGFIPSLSRNIQQVLQWSPKTIYYFSMVTFEHFL
jgi:hypothetical protein